MAKHNTETQSAIGAAPRAGKTLRRGTRAAWDYLGLIAGVSLTAFALTAMPGAALLRMHAAAVGRMAGATALVILLGGPLYVGACWVAHLAQSHDEVAYADLWRGVGRLYARATALTLIDGGVAALLAVNAAFYLSRGGVALMLAGQLCAYLAAFWGMNALYHAPLLVAGEAGIVKQDDGGRARFGTVYRNGLVMTMSAPLFTFELLLVIITVSVVLTVTGFGAALLLCGLTAFLTTQATRDQLARFGLLPPPEDPEDEADDQGWSAV